MLREEKLLDFYYLKFVFLPPLYFLSNLLKLISLDKFKRFLDVLRIHSKNT